MQNQDWWKPCLAEFIGVLTLVYIGAGSIVATAGNSLVSIALAHGLAIAVMVTALGHISGGHFNPAITFAAMATKRITKELGILYVMFQLLGGFVGAFLLAASVPVSSWEPVNLGTPALSGVTPAQGFIIETILTFFLVFVVFGVGIDVRNHMRAVAGLAIGLTISADILMGGPLTGAAMNPARFFGPALLTRTWDNQLVYYVAPLFGGLIAGLLYDTAFFAKPAAAPEPKADAPAQQP